MLCGGTGTHTHSFPKPDTVTISRELAYKIQLCMELMTFNQLNNPEKIKGDHDIIRQFEKDLGALTEALENRDD